MTTTTTGKCKCNQLSRHVYPEVKVVKREYKGGILSYELAICKKCDGIAWELMR